MGFSLPKKIKVAGSYLPFLKEGNFLFISGQLPIKNSKVLFSGKINNNDANAKVAPDNISYSGNLLFIILDIPDLSVFKPS